MAAAAESGHVMAIGLALASAAVKKSDKSAFWKNRRVQSLSGGDGKGSCVSYFAAAA
jgi:hypothetical protein